MNYENWYKLVPDAITGDPLWKIEAYRLALFLADLGWRDTAKLVQGSPESESDSNSNELADLLKEVPLPVLTHHASLVTSS